MSNGIAHNNLNDISKIYLETISDINKKEQEDDVKRWQQEEVGCDTTSKSPFRKKKVKAYKEAFSNWRKDLREVTSDAEAVEIDDEPEIKEKKVKNKIKINPEFKEAVKQMGGELLEVTEVDDKKKEQDDAAAKKIADKERKLKMRILRVKMMATKQDAGASIVAGYEPDIEGAVEYFYEEGINEEGIEQLVEEIGLDEFVNFIEGGTVELNEERAARRASVRAKKYDVVKKEVDKADAARKASKKGEYSAAYKKKETDVTVYDDKVSKKKTVKKTVKKTETVKKPAAPKKPVTKKVVKAVAKVKKSQPAKKPSKPGIRDKIATLYKRGVKRHRKATQVPRVFAKGAVSGAKKAVKFVKDVHKAVNEEELSELSKRTLGNYVKDASSDAAMTSMTHGNKPLAKDAPKREKKILKRLIGIRKATDKLSKEEVELDERLGGKGYKSYTSLTGKKVSGDWEDSDRGAGNKATRRAGGEVKAKSPTYIAHVVNKGKKKVDPKKNPVVEEKGEKNCGCGQNPCITYGKKKKKHNCASKVKHEEYGIGNCIKEMHTLDEDGQVTHYDVMFSNKIIKNVPSSSLEILEGHMHEHYVNEEKNKENFTPHKMIDPSTKKVYMANTYDEHMKYQKMGYVHEEKNPVTEGNQRDPENLKKDRTHSKQPDPSKDGFTGIGNMSIKDIMKMNAKMKKEKKEVKEDKALAMVKAAIIKKHGKGAIYDPKNPPKPPTEAQKKKNAAERKKRQDADNKAYAARAKKAGFKSTQDYTNVVARYGSEDNYRKGKGLGT